MRPPSTAVLRRIAASPTARFAPGRVVPAVVTVLATPLLTRLLDPGAFGQLAILQTAALLAGSALFGWGEVLIVRRFASDDRIEDRQLAQMLVPALCGAALVLLAGAVVTVVQDTALGLLAALCAVAYGCTLAATALSRARHDAAGFVRAAVVGNAGRFVIGVPLVALGAGIGGVLVAWTISGSAALALVVRRNRIGRGALALVRPPTDDLRFAMPVIAVATGYLMLSLCDRLILSLSLSSAEIAPYALGYSLVDQAASLLFSVMLAARFPAMVRTYDEHGPHAAREELRRSLGQFLAIAVLPLLVLALYGGDVSRIFGGPQYADADFAFMPFVAAGLLLQGIGQYFAIPLQQQRRTGAWAIAVVVGVGVNVAMNLALDPRHGTLGAGIATLGGYGAAGAMLWARSRTSIAWPGREIAVQVLAVAVAVAISTGEVLADVPWVPAALAASAGYLAVAGAGRVTRRRAA